MARTWRRVYWPTWRIMTEHNDRIGNGPAISADVWREETWLKFQKGHPLLGRSALTLPGSVLDA